MCSNLFLLKILQIAYFCRLLIYFKFVLLPQVSIIEKAMYVEVTNIQFRFHLVLKQVILLADILIS